MALLFNSFDKKIKTTDIFFFENMSVIDSIVYLNNLQTDYNNYTYEYFKNKTSLLSQSINESSVLTTLNEGFVTAVMSKVTSFINGVFGFIINFIKKIINWIKSLFSSDDSYSSGGGGGGSSTSSSSSSNDKKDDEKIKDANDKVDKIIEEDNKNKDKIDIDKNKETDTTVIDKEKEKNLIKEKIENEKDIKKLNKQMDDVKKKSSDDTEKKQEQAEIKIEQAKQKQQQAEIKNEQAKQKQQQAEIKLEEIKSKPISSPSEVKRVEKEIKTAKQEVQKSEKEVKNSKQEVQKAETDLKKIEKDNNNDQFFKDVIDLQRTAMGFFKSSYGKLCGIVSDVIYYNDHNIVNDSKENIKYNIDIFYDRCNSLKIDKTYNQYMQDYMEWIKPAVEKKLTQEPNHSQCKEIIKNHDIFSLSMFEEIAYQFKRFTAEIEKTKNILNNKYKIERDTSSNVSTDDKYKNIKEILNNSDNEIVRLYNEACNKYKFINDRTTLNELYNIKNQITEIFLKISFIWIGTFGRYCYKTDEILKTYGKNKDYFDLFTNKDCNYRKISNKCVAMMHSVGGDVSDASIYHETEYNMYPKKSILMIITEMIISKIENKDDKIGFVFYTKNTFFVSFYKENIGANVYVLNNYILDPLIDILEDDEYTDLTVEKIEELYKEQTECNLDINSICQDAIDKDQHKENKYERILYPTIFNMDLFKEQATYFAYDKIDNQSTIDNPVPIYKTIKEIEDHIKSNMNEYVISENFTRQYENEIKNISVTLVNKYEKLSNLIIKRNLNENFASKIASMFNVFMNHILTITNFMISKYKQIIAHDTIQVKKLCDLYKLDIRRSVVW